MTRDRLKVRRSAGMNDFETTTGSCNIEGIQKHLDRLPARPTVLGNTKLLVGRRYLVTCREAALLIAGDLHMQQITCNAIRSGLFKL